jgi:hypothetical protein
MMSMEEMRTTDSSKGPAEPEAGFQHIGKFCAYFKLEPGASFTSKTGCQHKIGRLSGNTTRDAVADKVAHLADTNPSAWVFVERFRLDPPMKPAVKISLGVCMRPENA